MGTLIISDADALIALFSKSDVNHDKAKQTLSLLSNQNDNTYFPVSAISEAITASQRKLSDSLLAETIVKKAMGGSLPMLPIDQETIMLAGVFYNPRGSKQNTFFDAMVAAMAKKYKAAAIFSFDDWYSKQGFTLATSFVGIQHE